VVRQLAIAVSILGVVNIVSGAAALSAAPAAQNAAAHLEFEVASIKPSPEQIERASIGVRISGSQVRISSLTLKDYVAMAHRVPAGQITGPDWIAQERFDIAAKLPDGASSDQVPEMLQALLSNRFQLQVHHDSKEFPVYVLSVAKGGPKLQESAPRAEAPARPGTVNVAASGSSAGVDVDMGGGSSFSLGNNKLEIRRATTTVMAATLTRVVDRPVLDMTDLKGTYDLTLDLTPEDYQAVLIRSALNAGVVLPPQALRAIDLGSSDPFAGPLQKFGLALESRKAPLDVVVVDSMRKTPLDD
jgi:uncharacterized protein (TIGR03435 family)